MEFGFDMVALAGIGIMTLRWAWGAVRHDLGRGERLRIARERRLSF